MFPETYPLPDELPRCGCRHGCLLPRFPSDLDGLCDFCAEGYPCQCAGDRNGPNGEVCCPSGEAEVRRAPQWLAAVGAGNAPSGAGAMELELPAPSSPPSQPGAPPPAQPHASPKRHAEGEGEEGRMASRPRPSPHPVGATAGRGSTVSGASRGACEGRGEGPGGWAGDGGLTQPAHVAGDAEEADPGAHGGGDARPGAPLGVGGDVQAHRREASDGTKNMFSSSHKLYRRPAQSILPALLCGPDPRWRETEATHRVEALAQRTPQVTQTVVGLEGHRSSGSELHASRAG